MGDILSWLRDQLDNGYIAAGEGINRAAMVPEAAKMTDPEYRRAAEEWDAYVRAVRARQAQGMLPRPPELKGRMNPARGMLPAYQPSPRPFSPDAEYIPSFIRG